MPLPAPVPRNRFGRVYRDAAAGRARSTSERIEVDLAVVMAHARAAIAEVQLGLR